MDGKKCVKRKQQMERESFKRSAANAELAKKQQKKYNFRQR